MTPPAAAAENNPSSSSSTTTISPTATITPPVTQQNVNYNNNPNPNNPNTPHLQLQHLHSELKEMEKLLLLSSSSSFDNDKIPHCNGTGGHTDAIMAPPATDDEGLMDGKVSSISSDDDMTQDHNNGVNNNTVATEMDLLGAFLRELDQHMPLGASEGQQHQQGEEESKSQHHHQEEEETKSSPLTSSSPSSASTNPHHNTTPLHVALSSYSSSLSETLSSSHSHLLSTYISLTSEISQLSQYLSEISGGLHSTARILREFQVNLGSISEEIRYLQEESSILRHDLIQNKSLEKHLISWIRDCLVEAPEIKVIFQGDIDEKWMRVLERLRRKYGRLGQWEEKLQMRQQQQRSRRNSTATSGASFTTTSNHGDPAVSDTISHDSRSSRNSLLDSTVGSSSTTTTHHNNRPRLFQQVRLQYSMLFKKSISRIRSFFMEKFLSLSTKSGQSNPEFLKINVIIKFRYLYHFLLQWDKNVAREIKATYVDIIQQYYHQSFTTYIQTLLKLEKPRSLAAWNIRSGHYTGSTTQTSGQQSGNQSTEASSSASSWRLFSDSAYKFINRTFSTEDQDANMNVDKASTIMEKHRTAAKQLSQQNHIGSSGENGGRNATSPSPTHSRAKNATTTSDNSSTTSSVDSIASLGHPIVCHIATSQKQSFYFEEIFKSVYILLSDSSTSEHIFDVEFFHDDQMHAQIFEASTQYIDEYLVSPYLNETKDLLAVTALVYFTDSLQNIMRAREITVLDDHLQRLNIRLIMKFKELYDPNIDALRQSLTQSEMDSELKDHSLTKRFCKLSIGVHIFNDAYHSDSPNRHLFESNLQKLRDLYLRQLEKVAQSLDGNRDSKRQCTFLIHAYDFILTQYIAYHIECEDGLVFQKHLEDQVRNFVRLQTADHFSNLNNFVQKYEAAINKGNKEEQNRARINEQAMAEVAKKFHSKWQRGIQALSSDVERRFGDLPSLCKDIQRQSILHLLMTYTRYRNMVRACYKNPPFRSYLVSPDRVMSAVGAGE